MHLGKGASVFGLLLFGTATSLFAKIVYQLEDDRGKLFMKPWAMTTVMFIGMSFCLPLSFLEGSKKVDEDDIGGNGSEPLLPGEGGDVRGRTKHSDLKETLMLAIPTVFDLIATVLMNVGLLSVTASVYQMMRGAEMVFAAMFAIVFLKRTLNKWHYLGITCCIAGITLVGLSSMLSGETGHHEAAAVAARLATDREAQWKILLGILLIIASQAVQAAQVTFEDYFMSDMDVPPMKIVGFEGLFGTVMMVGVMLPLVHRVPGEEGSGLHEDSLDTLYMITHSKTIAPVLLVDMVALLAYNVTGMSVTGHLGAVFRTVLETMRTLFVWLVDLLLFYALGSLGEAWTSYSFVQLAGFAVLVVGTLLYGRGDEREVLQEMEKLTSDSEAGAAAAPPPPPPAAAPHPIAARSAAQPMAIGGTPGSFKATMNMTSGSFRAQMSASLRASGRGSSSHSLGA